jgi:putative nucleotidyltransferase with HDIG domain
MFKGDDVDFSAQKLWLHSATVAILSGMIAKRIFGKDGENVFLAGIIHDIGLIVENQVAGEQLRAACKDFREGKGTLIECERQAIGADHAEVGYLLAQSWGLPLEILSAIKSHHLSRQVKSPASISSILQLAEFMAGKMRYWATAGPLQPLPPELTEHVKERVADYRIIIRDLPGEMAKAKELYQAEE